MRRFINKYKNNEIISKSTSAFLLKIIGSFLGYVFLLLVTRSSGAEAWGIFALCLAVLNITSIISRFGIDISLLRYIPELLPDYSKVRNLVKKGIFLVFIISVFISFALYQFSDFIANFIFYKPNLSSFIKLISFALVPFNLSLVIVQSFRGLKEIKYFAFFSQPARYIFAIIFFILLAYSNLIEDKNLPMYSYVIGMFFVFLLSLFYFYKKINGFDNTTYSISLSRILKTASPMMLSSSIYLLMTWIDTIMIGIYSDEANVGVYNVAVRVSGLAAFTLAGISSISAPKFSETYNNGDHVRFKEVVHESSRLIFFSTLPIIIILLLFNKHILLFFGEEFVGGAGVLYILLLGQMSNTFSGSLAFILQMTGKEKIFRNILSLGLIMNFILNLVLIPNFGILGASIASASSLITWNILSLIYIKRKFGFWTFEKNFIIN
ncbi:MAG: hypothetical protein CMD15_03725 [Flavobacteriales bacterium]|nr:hypothetical protein [Flavobacteriales bacterium]